MIHALHSRTTQAHQRTAARPAANKAAETNPFQSVLKQTAATQISATVTKAATPAVALTTPSYEINPTVANPDGSVSPLNWTQFADLATANNIAAKLGGTVTEGGADGISTVQRSIKVAGSPNLVNAGIAAQLFAQYGDKPGSLAWQVINRDLGRDPMST